MNNNTRPTYTGKIMWTPETGWTNSGATVTREEVSAEIETSTPTSHTTVRYHSETAEARFVPETYYPRLPASLAPHAAPTGFHGSTEPN